MRRDLVERLRAAERDMVQIMIGPCEERVPDLLGLAADRIAALEAEAFEGERDRAAMEFASMMRGPDDEGWQWWARYAAGDAEAVSQAEVYRSGLIPEAPARERNPEDDPRYPALLADAKARGRNENLDGSPRRHAVASPSQDRKEQ